MFIASEKRLILESWTRRTDGLIAAVHANSAFDKSEEGQRARQAEIDKYEEQLERAEEVLYGRGEEVDDDEWKKSPMIAKALEATAELG